jgi:hypothetical protein
MFLGSLSSRLNAHAVLSVSPRKDYILFSTQSPPAIQRIPWPAIDEDDLDIVSARARRRRSWTGYDTWMLNDQELPWLNDPQGVRPSSCVCAVLKTEYSHRDDVGQLEGYRSRFLDHL